ncbi:hypothetical protein H4R33_005630 [Dimargaris cristalligena]|nr:hypothetical protein H4R33_005630 [Dimargaris cristalligena]
MEPAIVELLPPPLAQFWDPQTASVDWCEENYALSRYIIEFFNTLSSLAMVFVGEYGARRSLRAVRRATTMTYDGSTTVDDNATNDPTADTEQTHYLRFQRVFRLIAVVGLGSILFHATLKHSTQMLDELPMVWLVSYCTYSILRMVYKVHHPALGWGLLGLTTVATVIVALTSGAVQFLTFHVFYDTIQYTCVGLVIHVYRQRRARFPEGTALVQRGLALFVLAGACWATDTYLCQYVNGRAPQSWLPFNPQLHAWWHVLVSLAFFHLCTFLIYDHQLRIHRKPYVVYRWLLLPEIVLTDPNSLQKQKSY